jgi:XTP/dITP diphosphohydrolase
VNERDAGDRVAGHPGGGDLAGRPGAGPHVLLATRNDHKLREFARLLPGVTIDPLPDELVAPEETGATYGDNALIKARAAAAATGRVAIADDSGIEAEALGGAPGVRSARFAGEHASEAENLAKLRAEVPAGTALRYVCVIARVTPDGDEELFEGTCDGTMAAEARGERGFGYDPIFLPADDTGGDRTMAELSDAEKDAISHRGRAARALSERLAGEANVNPAG